MAIVIALAVLAAGILAAGYGISRDVAARGQADRRLIAIQYVERLEGAAEAELRRTDS